jgi:hypothetical protein
METLTRIKMDATFEVEPEELLETGEHPEPTLRAIVLSSIRHGGRNRGKSQPTAVKAFSIPAGLVSNRPLRRLWYPMLWLLMYLVYVESSIEIEVSDEEWTTQPKLQCVFACPFEARFVDFRSYNASSMIHP